MRIWLSLNFRWKLALWKASDFMKKSRMRREKVKGQWLNQMREVCAEVKDREQLKVEEVVLLGVEGKIVFNCAGIYEKLVLLTKEQFHLSCKR